MAESGALTALHERCDSLTDSAESQYISLRDKLENIIMTARAKEDEIYDHLEDEYEVTGL